MPNKRYALLFITNLPSFYKLNLYNEINKRVPIFVLFTGDLVQERQKDFFNGRLDFDYMNLSGCSKLTAIWRVLGLLRRLKYKELVLGGWDGIILWIAAILSSKSKNSVVVESSLYESRMNGIRGLLKRIFMRRINKVYASGASQAKLAQYMGYRGNELVITKGVGVFNYVKQPIFKEKNEVRNFIYVGRLSEEKNLQFLISVFNNRSDLNLNVVGSGHLKDQLQSMAGKNICFLGHVANEKLSAIYQANDVFILPSISEPWGLVVEEALNNGLPIILSNRVGCADELLINGCNGYSFEYNNEESLYDAIQKMIDVENYNRLAKYISNMNFKSIIDHQVNCYIYSKS